MTSPSSGKIWRIGAAEFDESAARIKAKGASIALDRPCVSILSALLAAAGEAVSKDRLLEIGWPGRVVHENSLAKAIGRLRKALGSDGDHLKAIYGAGYCLAIKAELADPEDPPSDAHSRRFVLPFAAAAIGVLAAIILLAVAMSRSGPADGEPSGGKTVLLSSETGNALGRILWVDDHPENNIEEKSAFEAQHIAVYTVVTTEEALTLLAMYPHYDAVISDMGRDGEPLAGFKLLQELRARGDSTPFYLYTILTSDAQRELLAEQGGQGAAETSEELYGFILPLVAQKTAER